jgi:hypothetical protein
MEFFYDPSLVEEAVFWELKRREECGDLVLITEYHQLADSLYRTPLEERETGFRMLQWSLFRKLGFERGVEEVVTEFPTLLHAVSELFLGKATTIREEGADLAKINVRYMGIKLRPQHFLDIPHLQRFLRHECMHICDLLDPVFGYHFAEHIADHPAEEALLRQRYKVLWDLSIESRLTRQGKATLADKEDWYREFATLYVWLLADQKRAIFETLWQTGKFTHKELLELTRNPLSVGRKRQMDTAGLRSESEGVFYATSPQRILLPGTPCPLCRFPTYTWGEDPEQIHPAMVARIKQDCPGWEPGEGICKRCLEVYQMKVSH